MIDDASDVPAHGAKIAILNGTVNVYHPPNVVMRQHFHLTPAIDGRHLGENFWTNHRRRTDGYVADVLQGLDAVLLILGDHLVLHAVLPVQEKGGRDLKTSAQCGENAACNVAVRIPALGRLGSIHSEVKSGIVELLLNAQIRETGEVPKLAQHGVGDFAIGLNVLPFDLDIHGSRESKVEDLSGHVRG